MTSPPLPFKLPERSGTVDYGAFPREHAEIERLAFINWIDRGCPIGSPEQDWFHAEQTYWTLKRNALNW